MTGWIYLAAPLFTQAEIVFNLSLAQALRAADYAVYLPQTECAGITDPVQLYATCLKGLDGAGLVLAILDGSDADSGSCFEMGYAYAKGLPILGLRTDFRGSGEHLGLNLMLTHSCRHLLLATSGPLPADHPHTTYFPFGENFVPLLLNLLADYRRVEQLTAIPLGLDESQT